VKTIPLSRDLYACVDDDDFCWLSQWKWCAVAAQRTHYAMRYASAPSGEKRGVLMHRLILAPPSGLWVDHIDCDGLNNQRANLRPVDPRQSAMNRRPQLGGTSAFKGVWRDNSPRNRKPWRAAIRLGGRLLYLGRFMDEAAAAAAYAEAADTHFGEYARTEEVR